MTDAEQTLYVKMRGRVIGPFDSDRLKQMAKMGQLSRTHMLSADGENWQRALEFPELFLSTETASPMASEASPMASEGSLMASEYALEPLSALEPARPAEPEKQSSTPVQASWHYSLYDQPHGPVTVAELGNLIMKGTIGPDDSIWQDGMEDWAPISSVPQLAGFLNQHRNMQFRPNQQVHAQNPMVQTQQPYAQNPMVQTQQPYAQNPMVQTQQPYAQHYQAAPRSGGEGLATASLVCGIVGLVLFGLILGIIAISLGIAALSQGATGSKAWAGIILGIIDLIAGFFIMAAVMSNL